MLSVFLYIRLVLFGTKREWRMKVLIIGATGFIGSEIVRQLALQDVEMVLLVRQKEKAASLKACNRGMIQLV